MLTKCLPLCSGLTVVQFMQKLKFQTPQKYIYTKIKTKPQKKLCLRMYTSRSKNEPVCLKTARDFEAFYIELYRNLVAKPVVLKHFWLRPPPPKNITKICRIM